MTAFVDTNVLIRHLTGDPPDLARRATAFLASQPQLLLAESTGVLAVASFDRSIDRLTTVVRREP